MAERPPIAKSCVLDFQARFRESPALVSWAPGRVNLIGGHTDYNGGLALPSAINRWVCVAIRPRTDDKVTIRSIDFRAEVSGTLASLPTPSSPWERMVIGCIDIFGLRHALPSGFDAVFRGDVPDGAGLSSSAAVSVAWMNALRAWTGVSIEDTKLAQMCQEVEHRYLGVQCGLLDQMASLMSREHHVMLLDFRDLSAKYVALGFDDVEWVVLHSGVRREVAKSGYWLRVEECTSGLAAHAQAREGVSHFRDIELSWLGDEVFDRRLRHVITENARVEAAAQCVAEGRSADLGRLLFEAHTSLRDDFQVSCEQLDTLVELAAEDLSCLGARMVGAGFGGCTLNLVKAGQSRSFMDRVMGAYRQRFDETPRGYSFELVGGAWVD